MDERCRRQADMLNIIQSEVQDQFLEIRCFAGSDGTGVDDELGYMERLPAVDLKPPEPPIGADGVIPDDVPVVYEEKGIAFQFECATRGCVNAAVSLECPDDDGSFTGNLGESVRIML